MTCHAHHQLSAGREKEVRKTYASVRAVLEADGEGHATGELAVQLRLSRARPDGAPGDEVGDELGRDGVEELGADGDAVVSEVAEELARETETFVDFEGAVDVRVIDEAFPSDGGAGFLRDA